MFHDAKQAWGSASTGPLLVRKPLLLLAFPIAVINVACSRDKASAYKQDEARQMQVSPELRNAATFAGDWTASSADTRCRITLAVDRIESANAHMLSDQDECLSGLVGRQVVGWRPASDGIDIVGPDRLSAGFFSFEGKNAVLIRGDRRITLSRDGT